MTLSNTNRRIKCKKGSNGPKPNGSKPPFDLDSWLETIDPGGWQDEDNGKRVERSAPPQPFGEDTFGWSEYQDYLDKLRPGAVPLSFPKFMNELDMSPSDFSKAPFKKDRDEGVMKMVGEPIAWKKKYLLNYYDRKYLDQLNRDDLERLFDDIMIRSARRGRA